MLLVEQNAARTIDFCDRCVVLGGGEVRAEGRARSCSAIPRSCVPIWAGSREQMRLESEER